MTVLLNKACGRKSVFCAVVAAMFLTPALNAQVNPEFGDKLHDYLTRSVPNGMSGAVLVMQSGKVVFNKGYGLANKDTKAPITPTTVFDIGSNTKQFTAAAILVLEQDGKLKRTDPISKYFDLPDDKKDITLHQLMTHGAGLVDMLGYDAEFITREAFFKKLFASKLLHPPGTKYAYANTGYSVLGRVIELVSGQSYEAFLQQRLFKPAGMTQTGYLLPKWDPANLARGYNRNIIDTGATVTKYSKKGAVTWHLMANGGINSTQEDMLKWIQALKANTIFPQAVFDDLTTAHMEMGDDVHSYGYGWIVRVRNNMKRVSHNGSNGPFAHSIVWYPNEDILIFYATNAGSPIAERLIYTIEKVVLDKEYQPKPFEKNPYYLVFDFVHSHQPTDIAQLGALIDSREDFKHPGVLNRIGNMIMGNKVTWAVALFELNVQRFPNDGNLWDSLGEGYLKQNKPEAAKSCFEKALALKPDTDCHWCDNAKARLQALKKQ